MHRVKIYKNKLRNEPEQMRQPYIPNHVSMGVTPVSMYQESPDRRPNALAAPQQTQPRMSARLVNQPYAETVNSPIGVGAVPNVGNNMEHTWASLDGSIIDDISPNVSPGEMVDNNEFVTDAALNSGPTFGGNSRNRPFPFPQEAEEIVTDDRPTLTDIPVFTGDSDLFPVLKELEEDHYLLLVRGEPICSGPHQEIEEAAGALIFGNHALADGSPVPESDILVVKKVKVNVGVFLG
jgi:hypothetical protein